MDTIVPSLKSFNRFEEFAPDSNQKQFLIKAEDIAVDTGGAFPSEAELFAARHNLACAPAPAAPAACVVLRFEQDLNLAKEGYRIELRRDCIVIGAHSGAGAFWACTTLSQWLWQYGALPCEAFVEDGPSFPWRGFMLDVSRHFFPLSYIKQLIEQLSLYKFNRLHLHLTDDQGWRLEIQSYPKLSEVASRRFLTSDSLYAGKPDKIGFFSCADIAELVRYAAERHIEIVPEIDLPGHVLAALSAYPELACFPEKLRDLRVSETWGIYKEILCLGKPEAWDFVYRVLDEVCAMFPSSYIHLGGDEVPHERWEACPKCQNFLRQNDLQSAADLQGLFTQKICAYLSSKGKKAIFWDEVAEKDALKDALKGGLESKSIICYWRSWRANLGTSLGDGENTKDAAVQKDWDIVAAEGGASVISCPTAGAYFDYAHNDDPCERGALGLCSVRDAFHFPLLAEKRPDLAAYSIGVQANLWTEKVLYAKDCEYMIYPRLLAIAEQGWGRQKDRWDWFQSVWAQQQLVLEALGVSNYYRGPWE